MFKWVVSDGSCPKPKLGRVAEIFSLAVLGAYMESLRPVGFLIVALPFTSGITGADGSRLVLDRFIRVMKFSELFSKTSVP